jgi:hypothetical protein
MNDVPVRFVDDLVDRRRGYLALGFVGGRFAVTRYDKDGAVIGHVAVTRGELLKVLAASLAVAEVYEPGSRAQVDDLLPGAEAAVRRERTQR